MNALVMQALSIAALVWGQPACGQPTAVWTQAGAYNWSAIAIDSDRYSTEAGAPPNLPGCTIVLNRDSIDRLWWGEGRKQMTCTAIVHEWGHLTGHDHSADPMNVMYPVLWLSYWRCNDRWRAKFSRGPPR